MPRPTYVYLAVCMNYRDAEQWHFVGASGNPLHDVKRIRNAAVQTYASRRVLWVVESQQADQVAWQLNEWLAAQVPPECCEGGCFQLVGNDVNTVKAKAKELAKNFESQLEQTRLKS